MVVLIILGLTLKKLNKFSVSRFASLFVFFFPFSCLRESPNKQELLMMFER